ncbi:MAG: putative monovalent cation/H+ antiporter subunit A [Bacteroidetes bacterium]|nr:putative monovalent cation/H+ antiporter subunit A [Bacteroidota bacterium]
MGIPIIISISLFAAIVAIPAERMLRHHAGWVLAGIPGGMFAWFLTLLPAIREGAELTSRIPWVPSLGIALSFRLDGLSLLFALIVTGIGTLVFIYAGGYLKGNEKLGRFYALLFLFMAAMLGVVLADNLLLVFVFWELTGISSYLLIGFYHEKAASRASALQALLVTGAGGLALLAGIVLLGVIGGSYELADLMSGSIDMYSHTLYLPALLLIFAGAFTKSAQAPFHFWLPGAMAAPAPVSAYLHSATMVNAGVYLLARLAPVVGASEEWRYLLTLTGGVTMLVGAFLAAPQTDMKRLLAYSTVSALGMLVLLIGLNTDMAVKAALVFLVVHSLYKGALFMVAGTIDHETGTRDVRVLQGLMRTMPLTGTAAILAALSMTGFPPMLGFIGKELIYEAKMQAPSAAVFLLIAGVIANAVNIAVAIIVGLRPFAGGTSQKAMGHEGSTALWLAPLIMGIVGLVFGLFPDLLGESLIEAAVSSVRAGHFDVQLKLWHGFNLVLMLSVLTVAIGIGMFLLRTKARRSFERLHIPSGFLPGGLFEAAVKGLPAFAGRMIRHLQSGYLRSYLFIILSAFVLLAGYAFVVTPDWPTAISFGGVPYYAWVISGVIIVGTLMAVFSTMRMTAVAGVGAIGFGIAALYVIFSAPDLAITQILVETLTVVILLFVIRHLPRFGLHSSLLIRFRDGFIAVLSGLAVALYSLKTSRLQLSDTISTWYGDNSLPEAFGRNVVNVILVDFRALDTLGEITVLAVAAVGVYALVKLRPARKEGTHE